MPDAVRIPSTVWQTELPFAPALGEVASGLLLAIGPGERSDHSAVAVAAIRYRMPDPVVRRYRGRLAPAIQLVAIDLVSGAVYAAACVDPDGAPTTYDATATPAPILGKPAVGGHVNVDIVDLLRLPPQAARYMVFAWLDEWTSPARGLELPGDPRRTASPVRQPVNAPSQGRSAPAAAQAMPAGIHFHPAQSGLLRVAWNLPRPSPVVLMAHGLAERTVHWEVLAAADAPNALTGVAEAPLLGFNPGVGTGARSFALFAGGTVVATGPMTP